MDVDSDSSSTSDSNDEEFDRIQQVELKKKVDTLENKVNDYLYIMSSVKCVIYDLVVCSIMILY